MILCIIKALCLSNTIMSFSLSIAILTISDTRTAQTDTSGAALAELVTASGHTVYERSLSKDNIYQLRAVVSQWIANPAVHCIITTGGTGFSPRDRTPEALTPLFDKQIEGFGELFRSVSFQEIGSSTVQSRACAGIANAKGIFCLPGSTGACRTGWKQILQQQLDSTHQPCNFVALFRNQYQDIHPAH